MYLIMSIYFIFTPLTLNIGKSSNTQVQKVAYSLSFCPYIGKIGQIIGQVRKSNSPVTTFPGILTNFNLHV